MWQVHLRGFGLCSRWYGGGGGGSFDSNPKTTSDPTSYPNPNSNPTSNPNPNSNPHQVEAGAAGAALLTRLQPKLHFLSFGLQARLQPVGIRLQFGRVWLQFGRCVGLQLRLQLRVCLACFGPQLRARLRDVPGNDEEEEEGDDADENGDGELTCSA